MPAILFLVLAIGASILIMKKNQSTTPLPPGAPPIVPAVFVPPPTPVNPQPAPVVIPLPHPAPSPPGLNPAAGPVTINPTINGTGVGFTVTTPDGAPLNLRKAPDPNADVIATIPNGASVVATTTLIDTGTSFNPTECWYGISFAGLNGFGSQQFLSIQ